jgi:hypothetical protein
MEASLGKKINEIPSQQKTSQGMVAHICKPSYKGCIDRRMMI